MAKKSFILYHDQKEVIDELSDEQAGKLFKAIYEYNVNKKIILNGALKLVFIPFKTAFDRDEDKWEDIINKRSEAGKRHTGNQYTRKKEKEKENGTNGTSVPIEETIDKKGENKIKWINQMEQNGTNGTVSVSVSDNVNVNVNDNVSVSVNNIPNHHPTTPTDILDYCLSVFKNYTKEELEDVSKKIFEHYVKTNWKGVDDWKDRVKMWVDEDIKNGKIKKLPKWFNKKAEKKQATQEEIEEMQKLLEGYK